MDNLKIALTCLVVANHASQAYVDQNNGWPIHQDQIPPINQVVLGVFHSTNAAFFMAIFFMIAGFFIPAALEKKDAKSYLISRTIKLLVPTLILTLLIFPILGYGLTWGIIAIVMIILNQPIVVWILKNNDFYANGMTLNSLIVVLWETLVCIGFCISLPLFFKRWFDTTTPILKRCGKASFGVYLIHPFIAIPLQVIFQSIELHALLKAVVVSILSIFISYLVIILYHVGMKSCSNILSRLNKS